MAKVMKAIYLEQTNFLPKQAITPHSYGEVCYRVDIFLKKTFEIESGEGRQNLNSIQQLASQAYHLQANFQAIFAHKSSRVLIDSDHQCNERYANFANEDAACIKAIPLPRTP